MRDIRRILCPVDLSDVSRLAIADAVLLARWYRAPLTALHVLNPIVIPSADFTLAGPAPGLVTDADLEDLTSQVRKLLDAAGATDIEVEIVIDTGRTANSILEQAAKRQADLIVIGTHGAGGFDRLVLGSTTEKVLRKASCAVMTVAPPAQTTATLPFKRILCPLDFSDPSVAALDFALSLAQEGDAELTLLHVVDLPDGPVTEHLADAKEYRVALEKDAEGRLTAVVPDSARTWCHPSTLVVQGKAHHEILRVARERAADLIVMGAHGHNVLDRMLFGSTTNQVVRSATCPVLAVR